MKRLYYTFLLLLSALSASTQTNRTISLHFNMSDFNVQEQDGSLYVSTSKYPMIYKEDTLAPALPYICTYILIGPDEEYTSFCTSQVEQLCLSNAFMAPNPKLISKDSDSGNHRMQDVTVFPLSTYPASIAEYTGTYDIDGQNVLGFLVCPFRYDAENKRLYLSTQIDFTLSLNSCKTKKEGCLYSKRRYVKDLVVNPEDESALYTYSVARNSRTSSLPYRYLIVTRDSMKAEFQRLADWKTEKGLRAKVLTIEEIYQHFTGRNNQLKIKNALKYYYDNSNPKLHYVLLGGTKDIVPVQKCYSKVFVSGEWKFGNTVSDLFYACFKDMDWERNNDGKYGDLYDSVSLKNDIVVTRLPANNVNEAKFIVDRILDYESAPDTVGWKKEMLMCGVKMKFYLGVHENGDSISDAELFSDSIYSHYVAEGSQWVGNKYRFYDTFTDNAAGAAYDVLAGNLQAELQKGYSFVNTNTHGNYISWKMENTNQDYNFIHARSLVSPRYTVIVTGACHTNNYTTTSSCLSNSFIRNPNCGVVAYYGSSDYNIGCDIFLGPSDYYEGWFYKKLFAGNRFRIGDAIYDSKNYYQTNWNGYTSQRWLQLYLNGLCDPEMQVYPSKPKPIDFLEWSANANSISFYSHEPGFDVCVMSRNDNGSNFYQYTDSDLERPEPKTFSINNNTEYKFCVKSSGYVPYRCIYGANVFLQNETLSRNMNVRSNGEIMIGSNVCNDRTAGPVVVESGNSVIKSHEGITITGDFEIKQGASVEFKVY